jgi:Mrp family chromosome partitioning ATPase
VHFDEVVMIAPSATEFADALALAPQADGVLVAAELRLTDRNALAATLEGLRLVDAHLAGVVVLR